MAVINREIACLWQGKQSVLYRQEMVIFSSEKLISAMCVSAFSLLKAVDLYSSKHYLMVSIPLFSLI